MAAIPFIPFFALKDFGQMLIFSGAYATLYLVAVRRWPQLLLFVGSVFSSSRSWSSARCRETSRKRFRCCRRSRARFSTALPSRIQQRFHLWLDGFDPPSPEVSWWKKDYDEALARTHR